MPTFGVTSQDGQTNYFRNAGQGTYTLKVQHYKPTSNGYAQSLSFYVVNDSWSHYMQGAIYEYDDYSSNYAGSLIATTPSASILFVGPAWRTIEFSNPKPEIVSGTRYYIGMRLAEETDDSVRCFEKTDLDHAVWVSSAAYNELLDYEDPLVREHVHAYVLNLYCTYEDAPVDTQIYQFGFQGEGNMVLGHGSGRLTIKRN